MVEADQFEIVKEVRSWGSGGGMIVGNKVAQLSYTIAHFVKIIVSVMYTRRKKKKTPNIAPLSLDI